MIFNIGSGAPSGETLVVTAPAGVTVTASKDSKTKTKVADANGNVTFKGLSAGTWTVTITDGTQTSSKTIAIVTGYSMTIGFFSATITVTYPAGSTCTCSDGTTTLTAADTTGSYTFTVPNAGTWTVTSTDGSSTKSETVEITTSGQNDSVELSYALYLVDGVNDCTDKWTSVEGVVGASVTSDGATTITNDSGVMTVKTGTASSATLGGSAITADIDMSAYNMLYVNITNITGSDTKGHAYICVGTTSGDSYVLAETADGSDKIKSDKLMTTGQIELDVSHLTGSHIVVIQIVSRTGYAVSASFDSIYLE